MVMVMMTSHTEFSKRSRLVSVPIGRSNTIIAYACAGFGILFRVRGLSGWGLYHSTPRTRVNTWVDTYVHPRVLLTVPQLPNHPTL